MGGYFAIGAEGTIKPEDLQHFRECAFTFGAQFAFTVDANIDTHFSETKQPENQSLSQFPIYNWSRPEDMQMPDAGYLIGIEQNNSITQFPTFSHPLNAIYILAPKETSLSQKIVEQCNQIVNIPAKFYMDITITAAILVYDRLKAHQTS